MNELGFLTLLPALAAVVMAFVTRQVGRSLLVGVVCGAILARRSEPWQIPVRFVTYLWSALVEGSHLWILAFALFLGGLMGLLRASGSARTTGGRIADLARTRRRGQLLTWLLGLVFFFDDYANTLFVGSAMGPATRRLRISREKLAFIVDATAAPVASIAPLSTWIAVEVGYIADQLRLLGLAEDAYTTFLATVPARFYPIAMLGFGLFLAATGRDFGPMLRAERMALRGSEAEPSAAASAQHDALLGVLGEKVDTGAELGGQHSLLVRVLPLALSLFSLCAGLAWTGYLGVRATGGELTVGALLQEASGSKSLVAATAVGSLTALASESIAGTAALRRAVSAWLVGARNMMAVMAVLLLAWSLSAACAELDTAGYLVHALGSGFPAGWLPTVVFLVSAVVSFATGTSWGTMGIVFPLAVPLSHQLAPGAEDLLIGTIASVLSGAVFGDHCSPISDTTIMSAMASECDQLAHVRTQLPYALTVGAATVVCGSIPVGFGLYGPSVGLLVSFIALSAFTLVIAPRVEDGTGGAGAA